MAEKIIVPISYFKGEVINHLLEIDTSNKNTTELLTFIPEESHKVNGKGFTQIEFFKGKFYIADFNQIIVINAETFVVEYILKSPNFNDIHDVFIHDNLIIISNSGFDSIEIYDINYNFLNSINLLSYKNTTSRFLSEDKVEPNNKYYEYDLKKNFNQRIIRDSFHINNCNFINNTLIATSFYKKTLIRLPLYKEIAPSLPNYIHDCLHYDNKLWVTSVDGKIYYRNDDVNTYTKFVEFIDLFKIGNNYGWCRGLKESNNHFYIGITQINSETSKMRWNTDIPIKETKTGIIKMNIKTKTIVDFFDLTHKNISKVFGFIIK